MIFEVVTIFPGMIADLPADGVVGRAVARGLVDLRVHDLRDFTDDRHRVVDDQPYGGGPGMVLKPEPVVRAVEAIVRERGEPAAVILLSPQGRRLTDARVQELATLPHLVVVCGRYEGVDERVRDLVITEEISIGDYVLSGGELPALVLLDAVTRWVPGAIGDAESVARESFATGLLDHPHYTRPAEFRGMTVPAVLQSGNHADIRRWRTREALRRTLERRPELLAQARLGLDEREALRELMDRQEEGATSHVQRH